MVRSDLISVNQRGGEGEGEGGLSLQSYSGATCWSPAEGGRSTAGLHQWEVSDGGEDQ